MREDLHALLVDVVGDRSLSDDLKVRTIGILAELDRASQFIGSAGLLESAAAASPAMGDMAATAGGTRRLVYVHGICHHVAGFSDPWWAALHPFTGHLFGAGVLGQQRREVLWSDLVNQASATLEAAVMESAPGDAQPSEQARRQAADEIKETLRDRADREQMSVAAQADGLERGAAPSEITMEGISIPGVNCIDDFSIYLTNDAVRQQIINRFIAEVRPLFQAGDAIDLISHSWGTVVAYEGLRQLEDEGHTSPLVHSFFTVGSALSIGPVKARLRAANRDGRKPQSVQRWINLDAQGDLVGGPLKDRPFQVNSDFINLVPTGCGSFLTIVSPGCAHGSYFHAANITVNRDIFAAIISAP